jgi:hypothetical protein
MSGRTGGDADELGSQGERGEEEHREQRGVDADLDWRPNRAGGGARARLGRHVWAILRVEPVRASYTLYKRVGGSPSIPRGVE